MLLFRLSTSPEPLTLVACVTFASMRLPRGTPKGPPKGSLEVVPVLGSIRSVVVSGTVTGSFVITVVDVSSEGSGRMGAAFGFVGQQTIDLSLAFFNQNRFYLAKEKGSVCVSGYVFHIF